MRKTFTCILLILTLFLTFSFITNVNANDRSMLNVSKDEVKSGEEFVVSVNVYSEYSDLYAYMAKLSYDKDVFEVIKTEDFEEQENWSNIIYNQENNKFALINKKGVNSDKLLQIKLKVKEDAKAGNTVITINNITASNGKKDINIESSSVEVSIVKDVLNEEESNLNNKVEIPEENNSVIEVEREFPAYGILLAILIIAIITFLIYYNLKLGKKDPNRKKMIINVIAIILLIILLIFDVKIFTTKNPDVNKDGETNYEDSKDIMEYILEIERPQDEDGKDKDLNNDGKVTITDVAQATDKAKDQNYTANVTGGTSSGNSSGKPSGTSSGNSSNKPSGDTPSNPQEDNSGEQQPTNPNYELSVEGSLISNLTPNKGENITLDLNIDITPYTNVEYIIINGKTYPVEKGEGNSYRVTISAPQNAGLHDLVISGVILDNGKQVKAEYKVTLDVLKSIKPELKDLVVNDDNINAPVLSFTITDEENTFVSGKVIITNTQTGEKQEKEIKTKNDTSFVLDNIEEFTEYNVEVEITYDLDSNKENQANQSTQKVSDAKFSIISEYEFNLQNFNLIRVDSQQKVIVVAFESTNISKYNIQKVYINGNEYNIKSKENNTYTVEIPYDTDSRLNLVLDRVVLENLKEFTNLEQESILVFKNAPTGNVSALVAETMNSIKATIDVSDVDNVITQLYVRLLDKKGNVLETKTIDNITKEVEFLSKENVFEAGTYTVELLADYDRVDGLTHLSEILNKTTAKVGIKASIVTDSKANYAAKNEEIEITYTIESNTDEELVSMTVNGNKYSANKSGDGVYTIKYTTSSVAGDEQIKVTELEYASGEIATLEYLSTIEVLKDKLTIQNFKVDTTSGKAIATYTMIDDENSFASGKIIATNTKDGTKKEIILENEKNEYDLELEELVIYTVEIEITYDLDKDLANGLNNYTESFGKLENIQFISDYKLTIGNLEVLNIDRDILRSVKLQFNSTNISIYDIYSVTIDGKEHQVQKVENTLDTYTIEYPFFEEGLDVRKELTITGVTLTNNANITVEDKVSTLIFKAPPLVDNIKLETIDNNKIKTTFNVVDTDNTLSLLYVILKDEQGETISEEQLNPSENEVEFNVIQAGKYKIEIRGNYELVDGLTHYEEQIVESSEFAEIVPAVQISTETISDRYPTKNETIEIRYKILSNTSLTPTKLVLNNNMEYTLTPDGNGIYKISYTAPSTTQLLNLKVTKVYLGDNKVVEILDSKFDILEVLKDKPTVTITSTDLLEQGKVLFDFTISDPDDAMLSGKAKFHGGELELKKGPNSWAVDVGIDEEHTITVEIEYDLDYNEITKGTEQNDNVGTVTESRNFILISDYGFKITGIATFNKDGKQANYFGKNESIQLRFNSENKTTFIPEKVVVNDLMNKESKGTEYQVNKLENSDTGYDYYVDISTNGTAGVQEFQITSVKLNSTRVIDKSNFAEESPVAKIEVLKAKPTISNYTSSNHENILTIKFDITDEDNALQESFVKLIDTTTNQVLKTSKIQKDSNTHIFDELTPGFKYTVKVENNYSLSEDGKNTGSEIFIEEQIEITKEEESNFKVRNLTISKRVPDGTKVHISFENGVMSYKDVDTIIIDGKEYTIKKGSDSIYKIDLDPIKKGVNVIHVDSVKIENKIFNIDRNLSYTYEKIVPTAIDVSEISEDTSTSEAVITYKLLDNDNSVKSFTAYMKNTSGSVAATKEIKIEEVQTNEDGVSTVTMPLLKMNNYYIELRATCDIGDGKTFEEKSLFEKYKYTKPRVTIIEQSIDKVYVNKGESVKLTFKINTNVNQEVRKIYLGDASYNVEKVVDEDGKIVEDTYTITVESPKQMGVFNQTVTKLQIGPNLVDAIYPEGAEKVKIKVLKDIPTLTHFIIDEQNGYVTFNVNDPDDSLVKPYPKFIIKDDDQVVYNGELTQGGIEYKFNLSDINMNMIENPYNVTVDVTYDLRPDSPEKMNTFQKVINTFFEPATIAEELPEGETETEQEEVSPIVTANIFNENVELTGNIKYNLDFKGSEGYLFALSDYLPFYFECSTGTKYKVAKVIIDGKEYPVNVYLDKGNGKYTYEGEYKAFSFDQEYITFEKVILENGAALDIDKSIGKIYCMIKQNDPTFDITEFSEDVKEGIVRFNFKLVDDDYKLATDLTFTLMDSQGNTIDTKILTRNDNSVEFKIPNPPTSVYKLKVTGEKYEIPGYDGYLIFWLAHDGEYQSSINTSILRSKLSTKYPKKGETITIDYGISSTKVVLIDKEDHSNQDKAVSITALVINGKDYDVQALEEKEQYRIYYTAGLEDGIENLQVTHIKFSNGDVEEFIKEDKLEVLKDAPQIKNFKTENKLAEGKVKFTFEVLDPDNVLSTESIYAKIGDDKQQLDVGLNNIEFNVNRDELETFEIKATYDLDTNTLPNEAETDDNLYTDYTIFEKQILLTGDYNVEFKNIETYNTKGEKTQYFEKNENIKVTFDCTTKLDVLYPETIIIDGKPYTPEKIEDRENGYTITIPGTENVGKGKVSIDNVILNSGNEVEIKDQSISYEILKDEVKVKDFKHYIADNADKVNLTIEIEDIDYANKNLKLEIQDEYGIKVNPSSETLVVGTNNISFIKTTANKYFVSIYSTYDRDSDDTNSENYYTDVRIHYQIVSITTRYIEMKDIVDIKLYTFDDYGNAVKVDSLSEDNLNVVENCLVEVTMKTIPTFYSKVTEYSVEDNKLKLVLAYTDAMVYTGSEELKPLEVTLDILQNSDGYQYSGSFKSLVDKMKAEPNGEFTLYKDYDISDYPLGTNQKAIIDFDFKGTINGNGHTISNLTKPFFQKLDGATVENIVFKGITLEGGDSKGTIAITATNNTRISNVHVEGFVSGGNNTGALLYELTNNSIIEKSSATNVIYNTSYTSQNVTAGIVSMKNNSIIENCYVQGRIPTGWWRNAGLVVLSDKTCQISHNIIDMKMSCYYAFTDKNYGYGNGGIVSHAQNADKNDNQVSLNNNLSLVEGNNAVAAIYNWKGSSLTSDSKKNYQLDTAVVKNDENKGVITISKEDINAEFFKKDLELDEKIWNISDNASINNLPVLKGVSVSFNDGGKQPTNTDVYIPDYNRVSSLDSYRNDREITYHNMYKLMPFYDAKEIIRDGNKIPDDNYLNTKVIKYIVPFNKENKMISNLTTTNYNSLDKIYIVFEDGTKLEYHIDFDDYYGNVASYMITELNIGYNYNKYIVDPEQDIIQELIKEASKYDFKRDLDPVTPKVEEDSRLYKEHYENVTKNHIEEFVINTLVNMGYSPNFESDVLDTMIRQELIDTGKLKQLLFAYNYFTYWYNLDMDGINLADSVMFHSTEMFDKEMTMSYLAEKLVAEKNSATNGTANYYNNYLVKYTKISNLGLFLDYYVNTLTHYTDGNEWFKDNWKGGRYYYVGLDDVDGVDYTLWDHLKKDGKVQNDFLPLCTVPENSTYAIASPTQAYFGSLRVYMTDPNNPEQIAAFEQKVQKWLKEVKYFYKFAYDYWGKDTMNKYCDVNYDMRTTYTGKGDATVYNNPLTTEEPYHKYFIEAVGRWAGTSGGAYANGNEVFWVVIKMLDNFRVGTHETLHNQDSKIFLNGYGRRGGAEDYAAGFLQQYYRDGWVSPNIFDEEPNYKDNTTQNLRRSSVETDAKLHAFYDKYFRVNDFLDWIEAQAYFKLSDEQKANISVQVSYPEVKDQEAGDDVVAYTPLTADAVAKMGLSDMDDLWDNKIMLRPGVAEYERRSPGADTDSIFNIHWYQPHADNDRPDGANFKYLAWQMAGEKGYYEGLCAYYSLTYVGLHDGTGRKTTDLIALRYIMDDPNITFREYKLNRYKELAEHYDDVGTYIDAKTIYQEYLDALTIDANNKDRKLSKSTAVKKKYFQKIRQETDDFNIEPFGPKVDSNN